MSDASLKLLAAAEKASEHPLARSIVQYVESRGVIIPAVADFQSITGQGVRARVEGQQVLSGNQTFLEQNGVTVPAGQSGIFVAVDGQYEGAIAFADPVRDGAPSVIHQLKRAGLQVVLLTGDRRDIAEAAATQCGIERVVAGVLPEGKTAEINRLKSEGRIVAMVGDGINDAPALAQADVGFAMGTGTDIAMDAGDVTLLRGELAGVLQAIQLARATWNIMQQNLGWALLYNVIAIPAAALGYLNPVIASAAMALSSISVVTNSLRLKRFRPAP